MTSSVLRTQLAAYIKGGNAVSLRDYLLTLRNADFRLAGAVLADKTLWKGADFWLFATELVSANNRAFLGTMLKAASALRLDKPTPDFAAACTTEIDRRKVLEALLPCCTAPGEVMYLMELFGVERSEYTLRTGVLFRVGTAPCYYVLFNLLKLIEDNQQLLRRFGVELIRKGDKRSFNLACIIKEYFGLAELPGTFSLSLPPYELSRLDESYEAFLTILNK